MSLTFGSLFAGVGGFDMGMEQADTHRYKQCGNGVATPVAKWIAQHIAKAEQ